MYFNKYPYSANFDYLSDDRCQKDGAKLSWEAPHFSPNSGASYETIRCHFDECSEDTYLIHIDGSEEHHPWSDYDSLSELKLPSQKSTRGLTTLIQDEKHLLSIKTHDGDTVLQSAAHHGFGKCGEAHIFHFSKPRDVKFYGLGEKMLGLELSKVKTKFWNTDVWGDFHESVCKDGRPDPMYVSIPYLIIKSGDHWLGILADNPYATFIKTDNAVNISNQMEADQSDIESWFSIGSEQGQPRLLILVAKSCAELTQKFQNIVGKTPLPPVWALGYHQCRWGYENLNDLHYLNAGMKRYGVPCDGLWLDIDYMRDYRVFTMDEAHFPNPKQDLHSIQSCGRKVIPIIDPGVKLEPGNSVYESGKQGDHFCKNPQGKDFVGLVWPGNTVFPDFSQSATRQWWAELVAEFSELGYSGAWLDMNDPSTGEALNDHMLFRKGTKPHSAFHNQYGLAMAKASRDGFLKTHPNQRPFLLSRSTCTGGSKYSAIWTGDNYSNYHHLKNTIPCSINLALSGIPFNGPDCGGFGGDTNKQLLVDWVKCTFLFPILRNHSNKGSKDQEPWAFDEITLRLYRHYIRLRYKCRPYLYNLFIAQEEQGDAILRPLFYDFNDDDSFDLSAVDDQFCIGPAMMMAPFLEEDVQSRKVLLPKGRWYDTRRDLWLAGGVEDVVEKEDHSTPLYLREGFLLAIARNEGDDHRYHPNTVDFHVLLSKDSDKSLQQRYRFDDGQSMNYKKGERSVLELKAEVKKGELNIQTTYLKDGFGHLSFSLVLYDRFEAVSINGKAMTPSPICFNWRVDTPTRQLWKISEDDLD